MTLSRRHFASLPHSLLSLVFGHLNSREVLAGAWWVCRTWRSIRAAWPILTLVDEIGSLGSHGSHGSHSLFAASLPQQVFAVTAPFEFADPCLRQFNNLQRLQITTPLSDDALEQLEQLVVSMATEHEIQLAIQVEVDYHVSDFGLGCLGQLVGVQSLDLSSRGKITDAGLRHLPNLRHLSSLSLDNCTEITDEGFCHLKNLAALKQLNLAFTNITDAGLEHLNPLRTLEDLDLCHCRCVTDSGMMPLRALTNLQKLTVLFCDLTDEGLRHLSSLGKLTDLTIGRKVTDAGLGHLVVLQTLKSLSISSKHITNDGLRQLQQLGGLESLALVGFHTTRIDLGVAGFVGLRELELSKSNVTGKFLESRFLHKLQKLLLCGSTAITDENLRPLCMQLDLRELNLEDCEQITDLGLLHVSQVRSLTSLTLAGCNISDAGLQNLSNLVHLDYLDLTACSRVTAGGRSHLKVRVMFAS